MSYTEYLRRKAAAAPKIVDTTVRTDASTITMRRRLEANREFFTSTRQGVITNVSDPSGTGTTSKLKSVTVTTKQSGGRIPDASMYTAFVGGSAISKDGGVYQTPQRYLLNSNDAGSLTACVVIPEPTPATVPKTASQITLEKQNCVQPSTEPHVANELGAPLFVDDTIRLKHLSSCAVNDNPISKAIHEHPTDIPRPTHPARPEKGSGGIPVFTVASPDDARKVGDFTPRKIPYVEKHHGNDLNVNPRRPIVPYQIPANSPAHLKINDPIHYPVA